MRLGKLLIIGLILLALFAMNGWGTKKKKPETGFDYDDEDELNNRSPEMTAADEATSQIATVLNYVEEDYERFSGYEKNVTMIRNIVGNGAKDLVVLDAEKDGTLRFIFRDEKGQKINPEETPDIRMKMMKGVIGAPEKFVDKGYGDLVYDGKLPENDLGYYFNLKEYFAENGGEDFNFCFIKVRYKLNGTYYVGITAVNYSTVVNH